MKIRFLLYLLFISSGLFAQPSQVLWTGTTTVILSTDYSTAADGQKMKRVAYRSLEENQADLSDINDAPIGSLLFLAWTEGRATGFKNEALSIPFTNQDILLLTKGRDTVQVFNPETYESMLTVIEKVVNPIDCRNLRLHLELSLMADGSMESQVTTVALSEFGSFDPENTVFFPVRGIGKALKTKSANWNIVLRSSIDVPLTALQADAPWQLITERLLETAKGSEGQGFGDPTDWGPLSSTALEPGVDTVETFDPNTYEVVEKVTPRSALAERTESIRLYHFLAWDEKKARLAISSIGYAPLVREYNYARPIFNWAYPWYRK